MPGIVETMIKGFLNNYSVSIAVLSSSDCLDQRRPVTVGPIRIAIIHSVLMIHVGRQLTKPQRPTCQYATPVG